MSLPFQCLASCNQSTGDSDEWALLGSAGSKIVVQSFNGATSIWPSEKDRVRPTETDDVNERPGKRVKLTPPTEQKPNFSALKVSHNRKYLVAITAEDKCIRVFDIGPDWTLQQLTQRCMPRRPCSITLTEDDATILCADKFGDVYSLPLLPSPEDEQVVKQANETEQKNSLPAASISTVHSGRNRKVLEEQLKQLEKGPRQVKDAPKFKHELLLGHVSMLTDIAYTTVGSRSYIVTADRDEHIRVSRGPPQAHIVEGFCQGHEEFISRLCFTKSGRLVSGGGDPYLYLWDWLSNSLLAQFPIRDAVLEYYRSHLQLSSSLPEGGSLKVAVSGLWSVPYSDQDEILVACEGVPALFNFTLGDSSTSARVLPLDGNALDVAFMGSPQNEQQALVSIDPVHKPGSTTEIRDDLGTSRLQYFSYQPKGQWSEDSGLAQTFAWFSHEAGGRDGIVDAGSDGGLAAIGVKALRDMLYGVENLRKRPGAEES